MQNTWQLSFKSYSIFIGKKGTHEICNTLGTFSTSNLCLPGHYLTSTKLSLIYFFFKTNSPSGKLICKNKTDKKMTLCRFCIYKIKYFTYCLPMTNNIPSQVIFLGKKIKYFTYLPTLFQNIGSEKGKQTIF